MGKGTGDLYIKCFSSDRIIFSKIFVADCRQYLPTEYVGEDRFLARDTYLENLVVECDFKVANDANALGTFLITNGTRTSTNGIGNDHFVRVNFGTDSNLIFIYASGVNVGTSIPLTIGQYYHIKITKTGATGLKVEVDDTVLFDGTVTAKSYTTMSLMKVWYGSGYTAQNMGVKNIQIKPL